MEKRISMRNWCQSVAKRPNLPFQPKRPSLTRGWFLGDPGISHKLVPPVPSSLPPWVHLNLDSHLLLPHPTSTPPLVPQPKVPFRQHKDIVTPLVGLAQLLVSGLSCSHISLSCFATSHFCLLPLRSLTWATWFPLLVAVQKLCSTFIHDSWKRWNW